MSDTERIAFEAAEGEGWKANPKDSIFERSENGNYVLYSVEERWQGWMMRAAAQLAAPVAAQVGRQPLNEFEKCSHPKCGRFKDGAGWSCRALRDNACARDYPPETWKVLPSPARVTGEMLHQAFPEIPGEPWPIPAGRQAVWERFAERVNVRLAGERS